MVLNKSGTFWRAAGMSYLQYVGTASHVLRKSLKEPARAKALLRSNISYNYTAGNGATKTPITSFLNNAKA